MINVPELFGSMVFNEEVMQSRLPKEVYNALKAAIDINQAIPVEIADVVANAMKDWAVEKGATHFTHWFQPMTGITAEKHDSFLTPAANGKVLMKFSGKELIKGEPDASSFPSGGLRSTFEARGYTAWDPTSFAFIKDRVLYIPTAFISYSGQVLDKKTPLLRSMDALSDAACRLLKILGKNINRVNASVGPEQEYFLIPKDLYAKRRDLVYTGRTLFGAKPPKGQELEDHYFGNIKSRVLAFMDDLDVELWKLGIYAKTRHNEVAPAQHELAPVYSVVNLATDHNQLSMEVMRRVAEKHDLVCLLHEKPFAGVNGSGKHNNWSMTTDEGENLLDPGKDPTSNTQFLVMLAAVIKAVDEHQDLLRISVASAGNDHRLGASEAPPAIISMFLGTELTEVMESLLSGAKYVKSASSKLRAMQAATEITADTTDRNRTSPFAFTGNKFEFRSLGSALNIACPNVMINAMVAETFNEFADILKGSKNIEADARALAKKVYGEHKRIVFNGDNYTTEWKNEAKKRGLLNLKSTPEALAYYDSETNTAMFKKLNIYTKEELTARKEILLDNYCKVINIEALTMIEMASREILPASIKFTTDLAENIKRLSALDVATDAQSAILTKASKLINAAYKACEHLSEEAIKIKNEKDLQKQALKYRDSVFAAMQDLRAYCDQLETVVTREYWPFPSYGDLLYYVK